ncbi:50 kDa spicule matrix protein-like isoform X5 [Oncorhynchus keta]|uniref:50 kDa spicule matrix protein-like isoform X5 n=1 Tax=Oncorhynchus keta TaxID=8018 RepID=UPI00227A6DA5|nr:50 kDa spicule matrix protein-like isoform X5 [Oncorhynchus keta]
MKGETVEQEERGQRWGDSGAGGERSALGRRLQGYRERQWSRRREVSAGETSPGIQGETVEQEERGQRWGDVSRDAGRDSGAGGERSALGRRLQGYRERQWSRRREVSAGETSPGIQGETVEQEERGQRWGDVSRDTGRDSGAGGERSALGRRLQGYRERQWSRRREVSAGETSPGIQGETVEQEERGQRWGDVSRDTGRDSGAGGERSALGRRLQGYRERQWSRRREVSAGETSPGIQGETVEQEERGQRWGDVSRDTGRDSGAGGERSALGRRLQGYRERQWSRRREVSRTQRTTATENEQTLRDREKEGVDFMECGSTRNICLLQCLKVCACGFVCE